MGLRRLFGRASAVALGIAAGLSVAEVAMRSGDMVPYQRNPLSGFHVGDPETGWLGVRDYQARFRRPDFDVVIANGEDGFRRHEVPNRASADAPTVAFVGDSFTWGWGVPQGAVFTDQLRAVAGAELRVLNYGVNAFGTGQVLALVEREVVKADPDLVVLMFYENDLDDNLDEKGGRRPFYRLEGDEAVLANVPVRRPVVGTSRKMMRHSVALSYLRYQSNLLGARIKESRRGAVQAEAPSREPGPQSGALGWQVQGQLLERLRSACATTPRGAELRVVFIPSLRELRATMAGVDDPARVGDRLVALCEELDLDCLDLRPALASASAERDPGGLAPGGTPLYFARDGHWSAIGHAVVADVLAEWLIGD